MVLALASRFIELVVRSHSPQGVRPSASRRALGGRLPLFAALFVGWTCSESGLAVAQIGSAHDPICGPAFIRDRPGRSASVPASVAQGASPLSENGATQQASPRSAYDVKAALLYHCLEFSRWPSEVSSSRDPTTIIGLLGKNPFRASFDCLTGKTVSGRRLVVRQLSGIRQATRCQVVFISSSERNRTPLILQKLVGLPVLTVGETPGFAKQGGMISLLFEGKHVRIEANPVAAEQAGITLGAGLQIPSHAANTNQVPRKTLSRSYGHENGPRNG
jgi:hypothetical protein